MVVSRAVLWFACCISATTARNPLIARIGMADPHMHVFKGIGNDSGFRMDNWWVWSSGDLVEWSLEDIVYPNSTLTWDNVTQECWATDAATRNGTTYFYLSVGPKQIGVVASPSGPTGPFHDPLNKPLIPEGLVPTYSRDPGVFIDHDGTAYLIFGTFSYFISRLNEDMISLADNPPRPVKILRQQHRDDKPFLHRRGDTYYLSWGCFYAVGSSPYGPFNYSGSILNVSTLINTTFSNGGGTRDRHGSFFSVRGQDFFACNDRSHGGGGAFRNTIISYVHYRRNGSIATIRIDESGVGEYNLSAATDVNLPPGYSGRSRTGHMFYRGAAIVQAEDFYALTGSGAKTEKSPPTTPGGEFEVSGIQATTQLLFAQVKDYPEGCTLSFHVSRGQPGPATIHLSNRRTGIVFGSCQVPSTGHWTTYTDVHCGKLDHGDASMDLLLSFEGDGEVVRIDYWQCVQ